MGYVCDLKLLSGGFYLTLFSLFGVGLRYKDKSLMFIGAVHNLNLYLTLAVEE
jgi:hypothetical protein